MPSLTHVVNFTLDRILQWRVLPILIALLKVQHLKRQFKGVPEFKGVHESYTRFFP